MSYSERTEDSLMPHTVYFIMFPEDTHTTESDEDMLQILKQNNIQNNILSAPIIGNERFIFWFWESPSTA